MVLGSMVYGKGWGSRHLRYCIQMAKAFPHLEIVNALRAQLSWTHLRSLIELLGQQDDSDE